MKRQEIINIVTDGLNPQQKDAVEHPGGPMLVLAGAGSGKTRVLTYRIANLVSKGVNPREILAITFTNKAANEMKERLTSLLGGAARDVWMSTFHRMCVRILRENAPYLSINKNFTILDASDQKAAVRRCLKTLNLSDRYFSPSAVVSRISRAKGDLIDEVQMAKTAKGFYDQKVAEVYRIYQQLIRSEFALDFDDLIFCTVRLFREHEDVLSEYQDRFKHILVDEYQDTNHSQYVLLNLLAKKHRNLFVVGDDDQGIYKFRGADVRNILEFERDYPDAKLVKLEQNYRSTQIILDVAHSVIVNNASRKGKRLWTANPSGEKVWIYMAMNERDEARFVVSQIVYLQRKSGRGLSDFAILYRTHAQSRVLEDVLIEKGIPYTIVGSLRFYDRKEIKDVLSYLRLIVNPWDFTSLQRVINTPRRGIGEVTLQKIATYAAANNIDLLKAISSVDSIPGIGKNLRKKVKDFSNLMEELVLSSAECNPEKLIQVVLEKTGYLHQLEAEDTLESLARVENLRELVNVAKEYRVTMGLHDLESFLAEVTLASDIDSWQPGTEVLTMMTVHSAKGLEFPVVFMVGMEEGVFPHSRSINEPQEVEEERRLCYVGMTRAKQALYLSFAAQRSVFGSTEPAIPSRFLRELPEEHVYVVTYE